MEAQDSDLPIGFLVKFKSEVSPSDIRSKSIFNSNSGIFESEYFENLDVWYVEYDTLRFHKDEASRQLRNDPNIERLNSIRRVEMRSAIPNDHEYDSQWSLNNSGQTGGTIGADISAHSAWEISSGDSWVSHKPVLAVVDNGFRQDHEDLVFLSGGFDAYDNDFTLPEQNHGTHVSGILGAKTDNLKGIAGIVWDADIFPVAGSTSNELIVTRAFNHILGLRRLYNSSNGTQGKYIVAINGSFGVDFGDPDNYQTWCDYYDSLGENGILSISATANLNIDVDVNGDIPTGCSSQYIIAVTNTDHNDLKYVGGPGGAAWGSNSVDLAAPGTNILSAIATGTNTYASYDGTSMATPHVTGVVGLVYSVLPQNVILNSLTNPAAVAMQVKDLILDNVDQINSMSGITTTGGRLNALKAVYQAQRLAVLDQMINFKSLDEDASGTNLSRLSVFEPATGAYHVVFQSGSEIIYFKKLPWMTSTPIIISEFQIDEYGKNQKPNITVDRNGTLHVVWERKAYGFDQWVVYYSKSTNDGVTWSAPKKVSPVWRESMNPQILAYNSQYDNDLMLTYYYLDRIRARVYNSSTGNWDKWGSTDAIPYTNSFTQKFSSIASDRYGFTKFNITYTDDFEGHVYYNQFSDYSDWQLRKNLSSIVPGSATHHSPSISNGPTYTNGSSPAVHAAWVMSETGYYGSKKIIHRWTSDQFSWPNVYYTTYYQQQTKPTISGVGSTGNYEAYLAWEIDGSGGVATQHFNGSSWSYPTTVDTDGSFPSLSTGGTQTKYFYTDDDGPLYDITLSSQTLSKTVGADPNFNSNELVYKRSLAFIDSSGAYLEFIIDDIEQVNETGFRNSKEMRSIVQNKVDLSLTNALRALNLVSTDIDKTSDLSFTLEIRGNKVKELFKGGIVPELKIGNKSLNNNQLSSASISRLSKLDSRKKYRISVSSEILENETVFNLIELENYTYFKNGVFASLGHIIDKKNESLDINLKKITISSEVESQVSTSANPNPFNPTTVITFTLPKEAKVVVTVFDVLGREVAKLVDEVKSVGSHNIRFDASALSSGVYFYTIESGNQIITNSITLIK